MRQVHLLSRRSMRQAALGVIAALTFAPLFGGTGVAAASGAGTISGTVTNATHNNVAVTRQQVTLQETANGAVKDIATATTDARGHFTFGGLSTSDAVSYDAYVRFEGGLYPSQPVRLSNTPNAQVAVTVYDPTQSDANLHITQVSLLVREPRQKNGLIGIGEFVTFHNSGTTAFVGTTAPANGMPMGLLRFAVPQGASNLTLGLGFAGAQTISVPTGFGTTATVPPGDSVFAFAYDVPYTGTDYIFPYKAEYQTDTVTSLVPPDILVDQRDFTAQGIISSFGTRYQNFSVTGVKPNAVVRFRLWDLPAAGEPDILDFRALAILAGILALLAALLLGLYLKRGALAFALGLVPAAAPTPIVTPSEDDAAAVRGRSELEQERRRLLQELLALHEARDAGKLSAAAYQQQKAETRAALRAVLAEAAALLESVSPLREAGEPRDEALIHARDDAPSAQGEAQSGEPSRRVSAGGGR